jgi:TonB family protein
MLAFLISGVSHLKSLSHSSLTTYAILPTLVILITAVFAAGQSTGSAEDTSSATPVLRRIDRARALAAAHQLQPAATELENIRASVNDVTLRNVATLMLLGIYLENGTYGRAQSLLEEAFQTRAAQKDESIRTYFAAAGQTVNGIRSRLARYRSFGLNPTDVDLPVEANTDLDRMRSLTERVIAQAKEISQEQGRGYDALALQEDVLGIRLSLARDNSERDRWQTEYVGARERLALFQRAASLGRSAALDALTSRIPNPFQAPKTDDAGAGADKGLPTTTVLPVSGMAPSAGAPASSPSPTPSTENGEPKLVSTGSLSGRETKRVTPSYPAMAKSSNISGTVRVFAIVDEHGKVWVTNSEGPALLKKAAEDAARGWSFPPTLFGGRPARLAGYLDFDFKL